MSLEDGDDGPVSVKTFSLDLHKSGLHQTVSYEIQIPLPDNGLSSPLDFFGHLISQTKLPLLFHEEVKAEFVRFVGREQRKFDAELAAKQIEKSVLDMDRDELDTPRIWGKIGTDKQEADTRTSINEPSFEEQFQRVMRHGTTAQLSALVRAETRMTNEMRALVRARDFEVDRITRACELNLTANSNTDLDELDKHSFELSLLNEKLRQVSINYSNQIEALSERQRQDYRELVRRLNKNDGQETDEQLHGVPSTISSSSSVGAFDHHQQNMHPKTFKKSISCDSKMAKNASMAASQQHQQSNYPSESFTIYIGAQLKTMHNARILLCDRLSDMLTNSHSSVDDISDLQLQDSQRLHMLMSLYRRELSAVVLIVGRDPLWHVRKRTRFAQLCEQSAELHFDSLESQLKKLEDEVRQANLERRARRADPTASPLAYDPLDDSTGYDENTLRPGDVYITCHSNLSAVQVVFHLVDDRTLAEEEISSRHPCIGGLRNIVRLSSRSAIHITLPLLLVEQMTETMTMNWCLGRAELVYKCLKGFLMEVCCSSSSSSSASPSGSGCPHFNINFALPASISGALFAQLTELFSTIFHLVPSIR